MSVVLELLRGTDLGSASREHGVSAAFVPESRRAVLAASEEGLKTLREDPAGEYGRRMKSGIADLAMGNDLLPRLLRRVEGEKPFLRWRPRK